MALGTDHARREGLRARLKAGRLSSPLFDTDTWVRSHALPRAHHCALHPAPCTLHALQPAAPALRAMLSGWHPALWNCSGH